MMSLPPDLRLLTLLAVSLLLLAACVLAAKRGGTANASRIALDAMLLWLTTQYAVVCLLGSVHLLTGTGVLLGGLIAAVSIVGYARRTVTNGTSPGGASDDIAPTRAGRDTRRGGSPGDPREPLARFWRSREFVQTAILLSAGVFVGCMSFAQLAPLPVTSTDPLVYHLPTAVHWLQHRSLALYDAWYWMPANTYSPLAGTAITVWWMAILGNDTLARGVQLLPWAMIVIAGWDLLRGQKVAGVVAAVFAVAIGLSRPLTSQILLPKDDLFVVAFLLAGIAALQTDRLNDRWGPVRLGMAVGMLLATKYTAILAAPILLLGIDAPFRVGWRWRKWLIAAGVAVALAGPWYVRNLLITGNPLYPVEVSVAGRTLFDGMFVAERSDNLRSLAGIWRMLSQTYHSMPTVPLAGWIGLSVASAFLGGVEGLKDPVRRTILLGGWLGMGVFVAVSPHAEVRYMFPLFAIWGLAAGLLGSIVPRAGAIVGSLMLVMSIQTLYVSSQSPIAWKFAGIAAVVGLVIAAAVFAAGRLPGKPKPVIALMLVVSAGLAMVVYVQWNAYVNRYRDEMTPEAWKAVYGDRADAWAYVRDRLPQGEPIAFANATHVYPLYGFGLDRPVVHAPVRKGVSHLYDLPPLPDGTKSDDIIAAVGRLTAADPDPSAWRDHLASSGARWLYVAKNEVNPDPPELRFADQDPAGFERVFDNPAAAVYKLLR